MATNKKGQKVRFIRKGGRVIPIIDNKKGRKLPKVKNIFSKDSQGKIKGASSAIGAFSGFSLTKGSLPKKLFGLAAGGLFGTATGIGIAGQKTTKSAKGEPREFTAGRVAIGNKKYLKMIKNKGFGNY